MNLTADQLKAQTKATFSAWIDDRNTPIERSRDGGETWNTVEFPSWVHGGLYRLAPFTLTRSINGHTLADGQEWHRSDFTREDLPEGYRPLMRDEKRVPTMDEYKSSISGVWTKATDYGSDRIDDKYTPHRTTRPLPSVIAPGHNPAALTVSQVGEGWRLLDEDEIQYRGKEVQLSNAIECWESSNDVPRFGTCLYEGSIPEHTYRTRLSRSELAALDAPKTRAWDRAEDVPFGGVLRYITAQSGYQLVHSVSDEGVILLLGDPENPTAHRVSFETLAKHWLNSTDGKNFHPCTVPA